MLSLPLITPRDSHELWFGSSQPYRISTSHHHHPEAPRRNNTRPAPSTLSTLHLEERALRARKQNIASFGYSWIKPAGCSKTMLGMKEEEAEREEALAAAAAEMAAAAAAADPGMEDFGHGGDGADETGMERDLDEDIPEAEEGEGSVDGLVEEGEEGLEEEDVGEEEGYMERDLDDDIPEAYDDDDDEVDGSVEEGQFDDQPDLDDDIPVAGSVGDMGDMSVSEGMVHDLDDDIPEAVEQDEWQHTDTDAELEDDDDSNSDNENEENFAQDPFTTHLRTSTSSRGLPPVRQRETPAQRRFLQRWSGGGDAFDSSSMMLDEDELRASMASHASRPSGFGRFPRRGGPRDSFD